MDTCYWCSATDVELHNPEGAVLVGSEPLMIPLRMTERERLAFVLCLECLRTFAELRYRRECELQEASRA